MFTPEPFADAAEEEATYRQPPHNLEAEQALLGALLVNNEALNKVSDYLQAEHFFLPVHGRIFEAAGKLIDRGLIADPVTLKQYFERDDALVDVGGAQYLVRLANAAVTVIDAGHYGQVIFDLAVKRELILIGEDVVNTAYDGEVEEDSSAQIEQAEQRLFSLSETGRSEGGFRAFRSALTEAIEAADAAFKRDGKLTGVSSGLRDLDQKLGGLHASDLIILAGRPAMGKTALATNIAFNAAALAMDSMQRDAEGNLKPGEGAVVGFFSLEMSAEQLATRILAEQVETASDKLRRGQLDQGAFDRIVQVSQRLEQMPLYIDDTPALTISALRTRARRLKRTHGLGAVVVDYLQLLRPASRSNDNRVQEISEITQGLKALAKELNIPVLALSQLSRAVEQREDKRPQLADLRESGSIEQDADVVMFVFREEYYHERQEPEMGTPEHATWMEKANRIHGIGEVIIGKQRHGPTGTVKLQFTREFTRFSDLDQTHYDVMGD